MRISEKPLSNIDELCSCAVDNGITLFDNADIYGGGYCETLFGKVLAMHPSWRDKIFIQTKCGIRKDRYDLSYAHIVESAENSLKRLGIERLDALLLHRPDALMRPEEIARAFDKLYTDGKVLSFGVSNFNTRQIDLLKTKVTFPLQYNQMQFGLFNCSMIESGLNVNTPSHTALMHDDGIIEYCRINSISLQAYSPLICKFTDNTGYSYHGTLFSEVAQKHYFSLYSELMGLSRKYSTTPEAVAIAWILHHPAFIVPILGTTNAHHLSRYVNAPNIPLTDCEWYKLYTASDHTII